MTRQREAECGSAQNVGGRDGKGESALPEGFHTVTPQLTLDNAAQAIDWYKKALGATEVSPRRGS